jgi:hypothetical protein
VRYREVELTPKLIIRIGYMGVVNGTSEDNGYLGVRRDRILAHASLYGRE